MNLLAKFRAWRTRRYWEKRQFEHLRNMIDSDWRWLAHDPIANELTKRYKLACSKSWYQLEHETTEAFRRRIGLDPNFRKDKDAA